MNLQTQQELVKKAQAGDAQALAALWDEFTPKLFGYLINTTKDRELSEDLLQQTWLKAINALSKFESRGVTISAWLFTIAHNECRQHWRKAKWEVPFAPAEHDRAAADEMTSQNILDVEKILNLLSEDDREILRLKYIADMPANEIAKVLNINFVTVRVRIHRAIAKARAILTSQTL